MEKFYPTFSDALQSQLERCAEAVEVKTPEEISEFDAMRAKIKEIASNALKEGTLEYINYIMSVMNTFKAIYAKAHEQKNAHDARLNERRNALKSLLEEF